MDEEIERLVVSVRADTRAFAGDVAAMRAELEGPLGAGIDKAGRLIETTLLRAIRTGKLGFEDLKRVALAAMAEIAAAAIRAGIGAVTGGGPSLPGGILTLGNAVLGGVLGLPGRATGGPVSPGRAYLVGERGPEVFVPASSGSIAPPAQRSRDVRVAITVHAPGADAPAALARSGRQVARAVRAALLRDD